MAGKPNTPSSSSSTQGSADPTSTDPSGGLPDGAVGEANASAGVNTPAAPTDALDNGNSAPTPGSLDAKALADANARMERMQEQLDALQAREREDAPLRMEIVQGTQQFAKPSLIGETIPGGRYQRADGSWQNAHGQDIDEETGEVLDTQHNHEIDPARRGIASF